jgi:hypothetical protein
MNTWLIRFIHLHAERRTYINADTLPEALAKWKGHYPNIPDETLTSISIEVQLSKRSAA